MLYFVNLFDAVCVVQVFVDCANEFCKFYMEYSIISTKYVHNNVDESEVEQTECALKKLCVKCW